mgnify:CR=1 FL=1
MLLAWHQRTAEADVAASAGAAAAGAFFAVDAAWRLQQQQNTKQHLLLAKNFSRTTMTQGKKKHTAM